MALSGMRPSLISHGVISNHLPSLIQLENPTLQATTTKHSRQVWLSALSKIDITLSHGASAIKCFWKVDTQTLQSKVADSCGQPRCDRCFKEFSDSLTSLLHSLLLYPPHPHSFIPYPSPCPPSCFPLSVILIKILDPSMRFWFPILGSYCSEVNAACPQTRPVRPTFHRWLSNEWILTGETPATCSCCVNHPSITSICVYIALSLLKDNKNIYWLLYVSSCRAR